MGHHRVITEDEVMKLRVVFGGSIKTQENKSINDMLINGAVVQISGPEPNTHSSIFLIIVHRQIDAYQKNGQCTL